MTVSATIHYDAIQDIHIQRHKTHGKKWACMTTEYHGTVIFKDAEAFEKFKNTLLELDDFFNPRTMESDGENHD